MNPAGIKDGHTRPEKARRPNYLFSGLLTCDCCGASYTLINKTRYGCAGARNKGEAVCTNRATILRDVVEERVLNGLRDSLLQPDLIATFIEEYRRAFNAEAASANADRDKARRELNQIDKKIAGIMAAIEDGMYQPSMKDRMAALDAEKQALTKLLEESPEPPALRLHPSLSDLYRSKIRNLSSALQDPGLKMEATEALRGLISEVRMMPDADALNGHHIELAGELAGILSLGEADTTKPARFAGFRSETMVAGVGFEPTTFRL
nr:recombinase zinc beta ribbon domain-containing protein [Pseudorhodobacter turbinis]